MWTSHPTFNDLVKSSWNSNVDANGMDTLPVKLKILKQQLKIWNKTTFGNINSKLDQLESLVNDLQIEFTYRPSDTSWTNLLKAKKELTQVSSAHFEFINQKFKDDWIKFGDSNSKMFHALLKNKSSQNHFLNFVKPDGLNKSIDELKTDGINYFTKLYSSHKTDFKDYLF
jgi:hypothetical protein